MDMDMVTVTDMATVMDMVTARPMRILRGIKNSSSSRKSVVITRRRAKTKRAKCLELNSGITC